MTPVPIFPSLAGFEEVRGCGREPHVARTYWQPLKAEGGLWPTASSPTATRSWILPTTWVTLQEGASSAEPQRRLQPWLWLQPCGTLSRDPVKPGSNSWPTEIIINVCCFKSYCLWQFATQQEVISTCTTREWMLPHPRPGPEVSRGLGYVQAQYLNKQCHWAAFVHFQDLSIFGSHQDVSMPQSDGTNRRVILQKQAWGGKCI